MTNLLTLGSDNPAVKVWMRLEARRHGCSLSCGPYAWDLTKDSRVIRIGRRQFSSVTYLAVEFDRLFETLVPSKAGNETMLDFSRVHLHTYQTSGVTFELAQWPEPDAAIDAYFEWYEPQSTDLVFDLGAGCGVSTFVLSRLSGGVVAFEPDVRMRAILERNVQRHGLANVTVAREPVASLGELITRHGEPAFCRANLDEIEPEFLQTDVSVWKSLPMQLAASSRSTSVRSKCGMFFKELGFETDCDNTLGIVWARQVCHVAT